MFIFRRWYIYGLTIKQRKFADEYIISGNATEAYLKAYAKQSRASAEANARKLLGNYSVKSYIDERMKEIESNKIADQKEVMEYLTSVMRGNEKQEQLITIGLGEGMTRAEAVEVAVPARERIKAAELLGKRYSMWTDKVDQNSNASVMIVGEDEIED